MKQRIRKTLPLTLMGLACVVSVGLRPVTSQTNEPTVRKDNAILTKEFELPEGAWQFPNMQWTFSQAQVQAQMPRPHQPLSDRQSNRTLPIGPLKAVQMDRDLFQVIKTLMEPSEVVGELQAYSVEEPALRGHATVATVYDESIPLEIIISWPAYDDLWTEFRAIRRTEHQETAPMLRLPDGLLIVATRNRLDGSAYSHFVTAPTTNTTVAERFAADGWNVSYPPEDSNVSGVFWIASHANKFEVCEQPTADQEKRSLLIRRIEEQTGEKL